MLCTTSAYPRAKEKSLFCFARKATDGMILYQESSTSDDFLSLTLSRGVLTLQVDLGSGSGGETADFTSYADGKIHRLTLKHSRQGGYSTEILIDSTPLMRFVSPDDDLSLDVEFPLYVGGFPVTAQPRQGLKFFPRFAACLELERIGGNAVMPSNFTGTLGECVWCKPSHCANTQRCFANPAEGCDCRGSGYGGRRCTEGRDSTMQ